jgi:hypothetical protein
MAEKEILEFAKILLPAAAIIISVISLVKSNRNTRRQIRIGKIEEMIECLRMFIGNYYLLHLIYQRQYLYKNAPRNADKNQIEHLKYDYLQAVEIFNKNVNIEAFREKNPRLVMLANSYLQNTELKKRIISVGGLVTSLIECTIFDNYEGTKQIFPKYPAPLDFLKYIEDLETLLVKEMKLGYKALIHVDLMTYQTKFRQDLNIDDKPR